MSHADSFADQYEFEVFLSYSSTDRGTAVTVSKSLEEYCQRNGCDWRYFDYSQRDRLLSGNRQAGDLEALVRRSKCVVFIMSRTSLTAHDSLLCRELRTADECQKDKNLEFRFIRAVSATFDFNENEFPTYFKLTGYPLSLTELESIWNAIKVHLDRFHPSPTYQVAELRREIGGAVESSHGDRSSQQASAIAASATVSSSVEPESAPDGWRTLRQLGFIAFALLACLILVAAGWSAFSGLGQSGGNGSETEGRIATRWSVRAKPGALFAEGAFGKLAKDFEYLEPVRELVKKGPPSDTSNGELVQRFPRMNCLWYYVAEPTERARFPRAVRAEFAESGGARVGEDERLACLIMLDPRDSSWRIVVGKRRNSDASSDIPAASRRKNDIAHVWDFDLTAACSAFGNDSPLRIAVFLCFQEELTVVDDILLTELEP